VKRGRPGVLGALAALVAAPVETRWAVRDLTFTVEAGEMVGYIGPNGAGKSTTVKMLTGILVPTGGRISVLKLTPATQRREHAAHIGVVFGQRTQLWWDLPLEESFDLLRAIYRIPADRYRANLKHFRAILELDEFLRTPVRQLSLGQRMRGDLAAALLHDPPVIFLDEPTIGLDVVAKERIREFLHAINREREVTILLTTHDMGDIEKLCSRVMIIDHGRLLYNGPLGEIRRARSGWRTSHSSGESVGLEASENRAYWLTIRSSNDGGSTKTRKSSSPRPSKRARSGAARPSISVLNRFAPSSASSRRSSAGARRWAWT